ncbi:MAG: hypothetical protein KTR22_01925 [Flavobacteriaceae bacterium]|nr:hypothetical protein [Flavobacteriaceae bacterium]
MDQMKALAILIMAAMVWSCSQESPNADVQEAHLKTQQLSIKEQTPNLLYDQGIKGLYHGIFVAGYGQERGKLWINVSNDGTYGAEVIMVDGSVLDYALAPIQDGDIKSQFHFVSESQSSFTLDVSHPNKPAIINAELGGNLFFGVVAKKTTTLSPMSFTGTFEETGNPSYAGTWNFIADGTNPDPNGSGTNYEGLTEVIVTLNGNMYTDVGPFEDTTVGCLGEAIPTLATHATSTEGAITDQTTNFTPASQTTWNIEFTKNSAGSAIYYDSNCSGINVASGGTFTTTWQSETHIGIIQVDQ